MPQAVPFALAGIFKIAAGLGAALLKGAGMGLLGKLLMKRPGAGAFPINVTQRSTVASRRLCFGTVRASGSMLFIGTSGAKNKYLWYVVAYAGHQCEALKDLYLDKVKVAAADINGSTGDVSTASFDGKLKCWDHLGTQAQAVDSNLDSEFTEWTSNHRLRGICYRVLRFERSDKAFPTGAPDSVTSVLDGALLYDPRLDTTNGGSGSHRRDDPQTWEFSNNPALVLRWYISGGSVVNDQGTRLIKYGLQEDDDRILDSYTADAADLCDQSVSGANAPPSGAQARYTCDIEVSCDETRREIMEQILATMGMDEIAYVHGKWRIEGNAYQSPVHTFTHLDLHDELEVEDTTGEEDRVNQLGAIYIDAAKDYTQQSTTPRTNAAYVTQDGGRELFDELNLRGVTNEYRAQRLAELKLRRIRQMRKVRLPFGRTGLKVAPGEFFTLTHARYGWSALVFRCIVAREIEYNDTGGLICWVTALVYPSSINTDLVTADYETGTSVTNALQSEEIDSPTNLTATSMRRGIEFNWELGEFWERNGIVELWEHTAVTPFSSATRIWAGRGTRAVIQRETSAIGYFWVRIAGIGGQFSDTEPATNGLAAAALRDPTVVADPNFELSDAQDYWEFHNSFTTPGAATGIALSLTGGVGGGYLQLTGDSTDKFAFNKRSEPFPVITGQQYKLRIRWLRTGSLSSASGTDVVFVVGGSTDAGTIPPGATFVTAGAISKTRADVNAVTVNQWQEDEVTMTIANQPKSTTQLPFLTILVQMAAACTGGVIRVANVSVHPV